MKRILTLLLCALLIVGSLMVPANATASVMYTYISGLEVGFGIAGSTASCYGAVDAPPQYDLSLRVTLMRKSGSIWVTVQYWTATGSFIVSLVRDYALSTSGDYKVVVLGKVLDDNGNVIESASKTSSIITY